MPTDTPTPTVSYYANDIYNDFVANGLGGPNPKDDTNWKCCTYTPEGGAIIWNDSNSGYQLDLAVFVSLAEAETDESDLNAKGVSTNVVHACLLSYGKSVPDSVIKGYLRLMQTYCN